MSFLSLDEIRRLRDHETRTTRRLNNLVRLMSVSRARSNGRWALQGHVDPITGKDETAQEVRDFSASGIISLPLAGADAEVVVLQVGAGFKHAVIVGKRDESTPVPTTVEPGETLVYTGQAYVKLDKDGNVTIRCKAGGTVSIDDGGGAVALALKSDVDELRSKLVAHTHPGVTSGGANTGPTATIVAAMQGTDVTRGK
jgi:phage baseplate assembly protein V